MIPKVIVWHNNDFEKLLGKLSLRKEEIISIDADKLNVEDFRRWVNESVNIVVSQPKYQLVVWNADILSWECQAVLLKPLEEMNELSRFFLVVKNENGLMATILSRCIVENYKDNSSEQEEGYWEKVMEAWKGGPAKCIELSESLDKELIPSLVEELLVKSKNNLLTAVNEKRLAVIEEILKLSEDLKQRGLNPKLVLGDFLLRTWKLIKT